MNKEVFLSLNDACYSLGKKSLINQISLSIHQNDQIALVGKNGVGKTTLLNILSKNKIIDKGEYWLNPHTKLGYLSQKNKIYSSKNILDYLMFTSYESDFSSKYNVKRITKELKLELNKQVNFLSGGEKRKLALSLILLNNPDLLLLDEPTNHLDIDSISWLSDFLNNEFKGSFIVISHDRNFLKNVTNKVFWMDRGTIKTSSRGFYNFDSWKNELIEQEKRELKNKKQFLEEELTWLSRGVKARRKRNIRRKDNVGILKNSYEQQNREFIKSISKIQIPLESTNIDDGPNILINFVNVSKSFLNCNEKIKILKNFNFKLIRGEKIGVMGRNGSGKSTFLNLASNKLIADEGSIKIKKKVDFSFFDQSGEQFDDKKTIKKNLIPSGGDYIDIGEKKIHICGYVKNFLFDPKDVDRVTSTLSGGERNRMLLAKILAAPKEVLILDEPTNDLDTETIDLLIDFINLHQGSAFISSHDIDFLEKTCKKFLIFDDSGVIKLTDKPIIKQFSKKKESIKQKFLKKEKPINNEKLIKKILNKIEIKESYIFSLTEKLQKSNISHSEASYKELIDELKKAQNELEMLEKEWIEAEDKVINEI
ncbi:MAG: hypothetical protein CBC25_06740 [Pelagibacteraceae bacterium TMED65]|nr:hypothetical protein [Rickettsiales bacterium]OUU51115.1 MAG: hypothetical protein CBC25_06740 [Pelagibacteraceae bacterium TMED65]